MELGQSITFAYTGTIQTFIVPEAGIYQLEVFGGRGGGGGYSNAGGYSKGYTRLKKGETLYVVCGGKGGNTVYQSTSAGGYNGGGSGWDYGYDVGVTGGGGATHIAKVTGLLKDIGYDSFIENGLIVAGGAGGSIFDFGGSVGISPGGHGGGLNGNPGTTRNGGTSLSAYATQTSGYKFGQGFEPHDFGYACSGGGGGGFYGGPGSQNRYSGGGGSGWIGGVPEFTAKDVTYTPTTTVGGGGSGDGYAIITYIAKTFPTIPIGSIVIPGIAIGDKMVTGVAVGSKLIS